MRKSTVAKWCLRLGLAFVFIYASVEIFISPERFLKYVPELMRTAIPADIFLPVFGVSELVLAAWLISGWKGAYPSMLSALMMVAIVACNMEHFQILFRNVAIGFGALALVFLEYTNSDERRYVINKLKSKLFVPTKKHDSVKPHTAA